MPSSNTNRLFGKERYDAIYTPAEKEHFSRSKQMAAFLERKSSASENSALTYKTQLAAFAQFIYRKYEHQDVDKFTESLKPHMDDLDHERNPYTVLSRFGAFLKKERTGPIEISANARRDYVKCAKRFLRSAGLRQITTEDFHEFVSLDRKEENDKKAVEKNFIATLLNAAAPQLRVFLLGNGLYGPRPLELAALRECDMDFEAETVTFQPKYSKMRKARTRKMSAEFKKAVLAWRERKYRKHRITDLKGKTHWVEPKPEPHDLVFATWKPDGKQPHPSYLYDHLSAEFRELLRALDSDKRRADGSRREITFYTVGREFVRTAIANTLGNSDWGEYWMGHEKSTYYNAPPSEITRLSSMTVAALTFIDVEAIETGQKILDARIEEVQKQNNEQLAQVRRELAETKRLAAELSRAYAALKDLPPEKRAVDETLDSRPLLQHEPKQKKQERKIAC